MLTKNWRDREVELNRRTVWPLGFSVAFAGEGNEGGGGVCA